jgi:hypothetical protein
MNASPGRMENRLLPPGFPASFDGDTESPSGYNTFVAAPIHIDALRQFRTMNLNTNWLKDMRMELFSRMYERPIHPKDLALPSADFPYDIPE